MSLTRRGRFSKPNNDHGNLNNTRNRNVIDIRGMRKQNLHNRKSKYSTYSTGKPNDCGCDK